jgi:hypothetical protein
MRYLVTARVKPGKEVELERKLAGEGQAFLDLLRGRIRAASEASHPSVQAEFSSDRREHQSQRSPLFEPRQSRSWSHTKWS